MGSLLSSLALSLSLSNSLSLSQPLSTLISVLVLAAILIFLSSKLFFSPDVVVVHPESAADAFAIEEFTGQS